MLALPLAFLALVPSGAVAPALYDVIRAISAAFPFKPTLDALDAALNDAGGLAGPLLHLARADAGVRRAARLGACAGSPEVARLDLSGDGLPRHAPAPPAQDRRAARHGARDRAHPLAPRLPDVRAARRPPAHADRGDARHRPAVDLARRRGGGRGARARHPGGAPVRRARREGRAGLGRLRRRGRRPARRARDQGGASRARRDHRRLPVRVHLARPLRRRARRRQRRQRRSRSSCSPRPRSRTPARAPTRSRPAT